MGHNFEKCSFQQKGRVYRLVFNAWGYRERQMSACKGNVSAPFRTLAIDKDEHSSGEVSIKEALESNTPKFRLWLLVLVE